MSVWESAWAFTCVRVSDPNAIYGAYAFDGGDGDDDGDDAANLKVYR